MHLAGTGFHARGGGRVLLGVAAPDRDVAATRRKCLRHSEPDTAIAAGDDGHAAGKVEDAHAGFLWAFPGFHLSGRVLEMHPAQGDVLVQPWTRPPQKSNMGAKPTARKTRVSQPERKQCSSSTSRSISTDRSRSSSWIIRRS